MRRGCDPWHVGISLDSCCSYWPALSHVQLFFASTREDCILQSPSQPVKLCDVSEPSIVVNRRRRQAGNANQADDLQRVPSGFQDSLLMHAMSSRVPSPASLSYQVKRSHTFQHLCQQALSSLLYFTQTTLAASV